MHKREQVEPNHQGSAKFTCLLLIYHILWIMNVLEVLFLIQKVWFTQNFYLGSFTLFMILCMVVSFLNVHIPKGPFDASENKLILAILILFGLISLICYFLVVVLEILDLTQMEGFDKDEVLNSIVNILLFQVPVMHAF